MRRRKFLALLGGLAAALPRLGAAQPAKLPTIGVLIIENLDTEPFLAVFREALRGLGHVEGQTVLIEFRSSKGTSRLPELAAELVGLKVDVLVASQTPAVTAAKEATRDIPIVMAPAGDPVGTGLIASLARPGGNVTGLSTAAAELGGKRMELIREMLPAARRIAVLANATDPFAKPFLEQIQLTAPAVGLAIQPLMVRGADEFEAAFAAMDEWHADAVMVQPSLPTRAAIDLALTHGLPTVSMARWFAEAGGLLSFGAILADTYRDAATYVDKILKGARPADLPVGQPTRFELVVNLRTARALGLAVPSSILLRADEVIE
jgi:putative ABC transport system substrate-binding protein